VSASFVHLSYPTTNLSSVSTSFNFLRSFRSDFDTREDSEQKSVLFSADGSRLFTGGSDQAIRQWTLQEGTTINTDPTRHGDISQLAMDPSGRLLACTTQRFLRVWNAKDMRLLDSYEMPTTKEYMSKPIIFKGVA
jgi:WD40 repeat protein